MDAQNNQLNVAVLLTGHFQSFFIYFFHFQSFFFNLFFHFQRFFFFFYIQKNSKTSRVDQQSVLNL